MVIHLFVLVLTPSSPWQVLATVAPDMYKSILRMNAHDKDIAKTILQDAKWIWIGAGFVGCKNVALKYAMAVT